MHIAIMARILRDEYQGFGMQTLLEGLLDGISAIESQHQITLLIDPSQVLPARFQRAPFRALQIGAPTASGKAKLWWDHISVGRACKKLGVNVLYAPAHVRPLYAPCATLVSVFDMMYHRFPKQWSWGERTYFQLAVSLLTRRSSAISALSQSTRRDILELLPLDPARVEVIYPGVPQGFTHLPIEPVNDVRARYKLTKPFILFVGGFHPRKNLAGVLDAFEELGPELPHDLVITGPAFKENQAMKDRLAQGPFAARIRFLGLVPRQDLACLYNAAELFIFPSRYEGFGFPVLEALACGCPTITTTSSSLPEVAGDAALLIPPDDIAALVSSIRLVLNDQALREDLQQRAILQAQRFSWTTMAQQVLALSEKIESGAYPIASEQ